MVLEVPANADFVLEGYGVTSPREPLRNEGPFAVHTGYYTLPEGLESAITVEQMADLLRSCSRHNSPIQMKTLQRANRHNGNGTA